MNEDTTFENASQKGPRPQSAVDRLPPFSPEAEAGLLGAILIDPVQAMADCADRLAPDGSDFYDLRHQTIYRVLVAMYDNREPIDIITLYDRLQTQKVDEQVGGLAYISGLPEMAASAANTEYYADIVQEKALRRRLIRTCTEIVGRVFDYEGSIDELVDTVEADILRVSESRVRTKLRTSRELVSRAIQNIEQMQQNQGKLSGVSTGFVDLDRLLGGLQMADMIVIAARPSVGKTSLAMNIAEYVTVESQIPVGVFSLEMTSDALMTRMLCSRARVNIRNVRDGYLAERDYPKLTNSAGKLSVAPIWIDDTSGLSILQLRARARRMFQQYGCKLFVVDYLQMLHSTRRRSDNRQQEVADISSGIKALAKELGVPIVVLSQLNREMDREKGRKPRLSDLRESGAIEADADVVGLLYVKPEDDEDDTSPNGEDPGVVPTGIIIAKQRNGPTGEVTLTFVRRYTRFESAAKVSDQDVPTEAPQRMMTYDP